MTRARATADTQDNNGGSVAPFVAGKNKILNGDFSIWQRGTSFNVNGATTYTADRMVNYYNGTPSITVSRQSFTPGELTVATSPFYYRFAQTTAGTGMTYSSLCAQFVEDVRTLQGTVTFSFYAKSSISTTQLAIGIFQAFGTGGSSTTFQYAPGNVTISTSWQRYSVTITLESLAGKTIGANSCLQPSIEFASPSRNVVQTVDIWGIQLEAGSVATPFTTATGNPASELVACRRYYQRLNSTTAYGGIGMTARVTSASANGVSAWVSTSVPLRVPATSLDVGGNWQLYGTGAFGLTNIVLNADNTTTLSFIATASAASPSTIQTVIAENNANSFLGWSAEL